MPLRPALSQIRALLRPATFVLVAVLLLDQLAGAHEGHDHGAAPEAIATALPRAEAHSDRFEIIAILQPGGALTVTPERYADNRPVDGSIMLTLDGQEVAAERQDIGLFVARHLLIDEGEFAGGATGRNGAGFRMQ